MKRIWAFAMALAFVLGFAPEAAGEETLQEGLESASAAVMINAETGFEVVGKNTETPVEAAGLKRLPALLALCAAFDRGLIAESTRVTVTERAAREKGTTAFLSAGEHIEARALLKAAVMLTAGDAIRACLEAAYPADGGLAAVNEALSALGIAPLEWDAMGGERLFTVGELALISLELAKSPSWLKYSSCYTDTLTHENGQVTELVNPNRLVRFYSGCFGLATGSVGASQYAGAFIAKRAGTTFCAVVTGMPDSKARFALASSMLDSGFASYRAAEADIGGKLFVEVKGGAERRVEAVLEGGTYMLLPAGDTRTQTEAVLPDTVEAPVEKGMRLGRLVIKNASGETVSELPLTAAEGVEALSFSGAFRMAAEAWLRPGRPGV